MIIESHPPTGNSHPPAHQRGTDEGDLVLAVLDYLRGVQEAGGSPSGPPPLARQEACLLQWADRLGLLLNPEGIIPFLDRGGQEHEILKKGERVLKVTRNGVFGLSPGIELALVSSAQDTRRFHLWEASPIEYLERLHLQNLLVPGLNRLELPGRNSCRICKETEGGWKAPESEWPEIQNRMIDVLIRLDAALRKPIQELKV
jgi:hypothetical protein